MNGHIRYHTTIRMMRPLPPRISTAPNTPMTMGAAQWIGYGAGDSVRGVGLDGGLVWGMGLETQMFPVPSVRFPTPSFFFFTK
jgi:hypothetical protein